MLAEQYDPYIQYNGGFNTALGITNSGGFYPKRSGNIIWHRGNHNGTTTIAKSPDGFVAYDGISQWLLERLRLSLPIKSHLI